jgi:hypothetical protein
MRKMHTLTLLISLFISTLSFAQKELEPFIDFVRSTPAFIDGSVYFNTSSVLYQEGWSVVKIVPNEQIEFSFSEDWLQVRPEKGFYVQYGGFQVYVKSVTWTPAGIKTLSYFNADFTGLLTSTVSQGVADTLNHIFGAKLRAANTLLKRVRAMRTLGNTFTLATTIVGIFTKSTDTGGVIIPKYRGEIGLNMLPTEDKALNLYGMRVGVKAHDHYRTGFRFTGDNLGIYPLSVNLESRDGVDINSGKDYKAMMRLVLSSVAIDARGIDLNMHLGATDIITGLLSATELLARTQGPVKHCDKCDDLATFPSIRLRIEKQVRPAIMAQVEYLWPQLRNLNIKPAIYEAFKRHETCRVTALTCQQNCSRDINNNEEVKVCKQSCDQTLRSCLRQ